MLAAGLLTALAVHALFCAAALPAAIGASHETFQLGALKLLRLLWNLAGIGAAAYLIFQAVGMINGRTYAQARVAGIGAIILPLFGSPGAVTAFALLPLGLLVTYLLKQADWQALFGDFLSSEVAAAAIEESDDTAETLTEVHSEVEETEEAVLR